MSHAQGRLLYTPGLGQVLLQLPQTFARQPKPQNSAPLIVLCVPPASRARTPVLLICPRGLVQGSAGKLRLSAATDLSPLWPTSLAPRSPFPGSSFRLSWSLPSHSALSSAAISSSLN